MGQAELTKKILDRLNRQVALGGMSVRKTVVGEVILKCPVYNNAGDLGELAADLTCIFVNHIEEEGLKQIKSIIQDIL